MKVERSARLREVGDRLRTLRHDAHACVALAADQVGHEAADVVDLLEVRHAQLIGRDPAEIRRSTWATSDALRSTDAYLDFVRHYATLGFTDFSTVRPDASDVDVLRRVATEIIPDLRAGRLLA